MDELLEKQFLIQLQKDLLEDRENERCQADPIYYGIMDTHEYVCPEGHEYKIYLYDEDAAESITIEEYFESLSEEEKQELYENTDSGLMDDDDGEGIYIDDDYSFAECVEDGNPNIHIYYTQEVSQIEKDLLFLTRKDANEYLEKKGYHHSKDARSYAMTAARSWRYEHLLKLLKSVDWEKSTLVFKEE